MSVKSFLILLILAVFLAVPATAGEGFWTPIGPAGLFTPSGPVFTHPAAPGTLWVNAYKSTNRGSTWTWAGAPYPAGYVSSVAADLSLPGALWAATSTEFLHTRGNGAPWRRVSGPTYSAVLGTDFPGEITASPGAIYLSAYQRLLGSFDGGATWRTVFNTSEDAWVQDVVPATPGILYISVNTNGRNQLLKTQDAGGTWTPLPCPFLSEFGCETDNLASSQEALFIAPSTTPAGVLRSLDGGLTWQNVLKGTEAEPLWNTRLFVDRQTPGTLWVIGGETLWLSRDNGTTWTRRGPVTVTQVVAAGPETGVLYAYSEKGIARSTNGGRTWNDVFPVLREPDRPPGRVAFQPGHPSRMAFVYGHELFLSEASANGGATWRWVPSAPVGINDVVIDPADPNRMTAVGNTIAATANGGKTWWTVSRGYFPEIEMVVRARGKTLFAGGCGVLRSRDNGKTWAQVLSCSSPRDRHAIQIVQKLVADPARPDLVFALTFLDRDYYPNHGPMNGLPSILWRSRDGGRTWRNIANDLDAFAWDAASSRLWIVRGATLSASDDLGTNWRKMATVPLERPDEPITDLAVPPGLPGTLYLIGGSSLLLTPDEGRNWEAMGPGVVTLLALAPDDPRTLYAMSHQGIFRLRLPE